MKTVTFQQRENADEAILVDGEIVASIFILDPYTSSVQVDEGFVALKRVADKEELRAILETAENTTMRDAFATVAALQKEVSQVEYSDPERRPLLDRYERAKAIAEYLLIRNTGLSSNRIRDFM